MMPKLLSCELLPPSTAEIPMPSAMINGTVMGPVVTPPESNARGMNSLSTNAARKKRIPYKTINMYRSGTLSAIRRTASTKNAPTPNAIV